MSNASNSRNKTAFSHISNSIDDESSRNQNADLAMPDSDTAPSSTTDRKVNLNQSITSLRDVEMCDQDTKHPQNSNATSGHSTSSKSIISAGLDDDDLYQHPSSSSRDTNATGANNDEEEVEEEDDDEEEDEDEDMATSLRQASRRHRDAFGLDDDEDDDDDDDDEDEDDEDEDHDQDHAVASGDDDNEDDDDDDDDDEIPFRSAHSLLQHFQDPFGSMSQLINGMAIRIDPCIEAITQREDPMNVMVGLQELAELILMTNEETLIELLPTQKVLDSLTDVMVDPLFEDNVEISLMACRALCNLLDAHPSSLDKHSYSRVVRVLCQKLFEIQYIDIAEQALTVSILTSLSRPSLTF